MNAFLRVFHVFLLLNLALHSEAKVFTRCQLTTELIKKSVQKTFISNWVCLIEHESERNTSKVTAKSDGSSNYGIFQINSKKWCKIGKKGGLCNIACEALLNDDITDDCACALKIFDTEGLKSWNTWVRKCKGSRLPDVEKCPGFHDTPRSSPDRILNYVKGQPIAAAG